ncbi:glutathione-disulfide reductase [Variovorax sp. ZT4R33]|uniref:glutathione-disulfide reductase n=1 Tax=Variovorax sp. ZT4R33 TaxID=3443743 RepID=UPI003F48429F
MPTFDFDLFVIGGGSGGVRAARMAAQRGARVALAEVADLGGTCVNVGCIPKKLYSYAAGYAEAFEEAPGYGWQLGEARFDWPTLRANRAREITRLNGVYRGLLDAAGVTLVIGWAHLEDAHTVKVGQARHTARRILVVTGGRPFVPPLPGREHVQVSDGMFDLPDFPKRLVIVGGGYIACEFASIFNGLGAEVTLVQRQPHLLNGFDEDVRVFLAREMGKAGVDIRLNTEVASVARNRGKDAPLAVMLSRGQQLEADTVLYATGRVPNTEGLCLEAAGVTLDERGAVKVDAHYRSSVPSVYALGDVSTKMQLTPVALAEAMAVVDALFGDGRRKVDYDYVPTAVFTHPNVGTCGLTEAEARKKYEKVTLFSSEFKALRHTLSGRQERTFLKLIVDTASDRVVGLHMVGPEAGEVVQGFAVAMRAGATKAHFDSTIGIHPTVAEEFVTMREPMPG